MKRILAIALALVICFGLVACTAGGNDEPKIESGKLQAAHQAVLDYFGDTYVATGAVPEEMIADMHGIDVSKAKEYIVEQPMISAQNDLFIGIEANEGEIEAVTAELTARRDALVADQMQYPQNMLKTNASQVVTFGNYAFLLVLGNFDDTITDDAEQQAHLESQVNEVVELIKTALGA